MDSCDNNHSKINWLFVNAVTENPRVAGSIPALATNLSLYNQYVTINYSKDLTSI